MPDATELVKIIKKAALEAILASDPVNILFGVVVEEKPLMIDVEQKMKLKEKQLVLSRNVTDFKTEISVDTGTDEALEAHNHELTIGIEPAGEPLHLHETVCSIETKELRHSHKIKKRMEVTIHNRLAVGDKVILLRSQGGQKYLVVDRIG